MQTTSDPPHASVFSARRVGIVVTAVLLTALVAFSTRSTTQGTAKDEVDSFLSLEKNPFVKEDDGCPYPRVRRDWHDLKQSERNIYFDAWWKLKRKGVIDTFVESHQRAGVHHHLDFLVWHRYYVFELEQQIRALGGKFKCFTLPYWDWSRLAGKRVKDNPLWKQGLGGNGVMNSFDRWYHRNFGEYYPHKLLHLGQFPTWETVVYGGCVRDGRFGVDTGYRISTGDCLRRRFHAGRHWYQTTEQTLHLVNKKMSYNRFERHFEPWHDNAHNSIGGTMTPATISPNDPIFYLLHSYVDMIWAMRSDCHGYDDIDPTSPSRSVFPKRLLYKKLGYPAIDRHRWSLTRYYKITPVMLLNLRNLGVTYHVSDMIYRTGMRMDNCKFTWFRGTNKRKSAVETLLSDRALMKKACMKVFEPCQYKEQLVGCSKYFNKEITLKIILDRPGVKGNSCLMRTRRALYWRAKRRGKLRELCDGNMDPVC